MISFVSSQQTINRDAGCGTTKECFPSSCTTDCDYLVTWAMSGTDNMEFTLQKKTDSNNYYIAIGLSADNQMVNIISSSIKVHVLVAFYIFLIFNLFYKMKGHLTTIYYLGMIKKQTIHFTRFDKNYVE